MNKKNVKKIIKEASDSEQDLYPFDKIKLPLALKVLGIICIVQCILSAPVAYTYIVDFIYGLQNGSFGDHSTSFIILYSVFLAGMVALISLLIAIGVNLFLNKRRLAAKLSSAAAIVVAIATASDVMLVGVKPVIIVLILAIVLLIALKSYTDPSLSDERKLQNKLRDLENKSDTEDGSIGFDKEKDIVKINYFNIFWLFFIMCFIGYIWEIVWHMTVDNPGVYEERAGFLFGPFSPIYGFGAVIITLILNRFSNKNIIIIFIISALLGGFFEYFVSIYLEVCFGIRSWDYSHIPFNIDGRTSLRFFIIWGFIGLIWIKFILKWLVKLINKIPWKLRYTITFIATAFIVVNMVMTFQALDCWYARSAGREPADAIEQFYEKNFNDDFMEHRFENMKLDPHNSIRGAD